MLEVYQKKNKIVIESVDKIEGERSSNRIEILKEKFVSKEKIEISSQPFEKTIIGKLPYTETKKLLYVDLNQVEDNDYSFELLCGEDEYFFVIEWRCFEIYNHLDHASEEELLLENIDKDTFPFYFLSKHRVMKHKLQGNNRLEANLTYKQIKRLITYSSKEQKDIEFLFSSDYLRVPNLLNEYDSYNKKGFYIIFGKFESTDQFNKIIFNTELGYSKLSYGEIVGNKENREDSSLGYGEILESKESKEDREKIEKPIVVIVHGLGSSCSKNKAYGNLISYLVPNFHVFTFDYLTINQSIDTSGKILAEKLKTLKARFPKKEIVVISHSMGGLVSRSAIVRHNASLDYLITAGTPHKGSKLASLKRLAGLGVVCANIFNIKPKDFKDALHGHLEGLRDLGNKTDYIAELNLDDTKNEDKYYYIAGNFFKRSSDGIVSVSDAIRTRNDIRKNHEIRKWYHTNYFKKDVKETFDVALKDIIKDKHLTV